MLEQVGRIDVHTLARVTANIDKQIESLRRQRRRSVGKPAALTLAGPGAAQAWERATLKQRRAVVAELLEIKVLPAHKGARTFDPESVEITWR